ncbi:hypothetical protein ES689_13330 [Frigoribacterium sp. ACAM 257]|uniref:hypothetical protein n=1 Tax=Frigoribacterium sp. ACAM 257 TaxID=2508998 RepID=UPI0011B9AB0D|nr:hypothetical protein [Frigoribacterium sp. ACAM 257]TWX35560.1 hypothetical protein ES689_13330 [Frigoribacterium sp. ACAM 257]
MHTTSCTTSRSATRARRSVRSVLSAVAMVTAAVLLATVVPPLAPSASAASPVASDVGTLAPGRFPAPSQVPDFVYRFDTRSPAEIVAAEGFNPKGENWNLADHVIGGRGREATSKFVSTAGSEESAVEFMRRTGKLEGYIYKIQPDLFFTNVPISINAALLENPSWYAKWQSRSGGKFARFVRSQNEWASGGPIDIGQIHSADYWVHAKVDDRPPGFVKARPGDPHHWRNPSPEPVAPGWEATLDPYEIKSDTGCVVQSLCDLTPPSEEELSDLHGDRFDGEVDDLDLTLRPEDLEMADGSLLAPLPESIATVDAFAESSMDAAELGRFGDELTGSFRADQAALKTLTADADLLRAVGAKLGRAVDLGSELVPYVGIAATGYALAEDVEAGRWGDASADAIMEGLQVTEAEFPEFTPFLEPLIMATAVVQMIGDFLWSWTHPKPAVSAEQEGEILGAADAADSVLGNSTEVWNKEKTTLAQSYLEQHVTAGMADALAARISADLAIIVAGRDAAYDELCGARHAAELQAGGPTAEIQRHFDESVQSLLLAAHDAQIDRLEQYRERMGPMIDATAAEIWAHDDLGVVRQKFIDETLQPYVRDSTRVVWEAFTGKKESHWYSELGGDWVHDTQVERAAWEANTAWAFVQMDENRRAPSSGYLPDEGHIGRLLSDAVDDRIQAALLDPLPGRARLERAEWWDDSVRIKGAGVPQTAVETQQESGEWLPNRPVLFETGPDGRFADITWVERIVDGKAAVRIGGTVSNAVAPRPSITRVSWDGNSITIEGYGEPGAVVKTTNDPTAGWYDIETGRVRTDSRGHFTVTTERSVGGAAQVALFGRTPGPSLSDMRRPG